MGGLYICLNPSPRWITLGFEGQHHKQLVHRNWLRRDSRNVTTNDRLIVKTRAVQESLPSIEKEMPQTKQTSAGVPVDHVKLVMEEIGELGKNCARCFSILVNY
jgi:hypothetical protein